MAAIVKRFLYLQLSLCLAWDPHALADLATVSHDHYSVVLLGFCFWKGSGRPFSRSLHVRFLLPSMLFLPGLSSVPVFSAQPPEGAWFSLMCHCSAPSLPRASNFTGVFTVTSEALHNSASVTSLTPSSAHPSSLSHSDFSTSLKSLPPLDLYLCCLWLSGHPLDVCRTSPHFTHYHCTS